MSAEKTLTELFKSGKLLRSFEVFPPKTDEGVSSLMRHLERLSLYAPDYVSVTYGAGGSNQSRSLEVLDKIHEFYKGESGVVAHFTCVGLDLSTIDAFLSKLKGMGVRNILSLRGDPPKNNPSFDFSKNVFKYASDLVSYLRERSDFCIGVAGYPEGHPASATRESDWDHLKEKVDAGAEFIITQLFFDNADFFRFREGLDKRGISIPVIPGILPVNSLEGLEKSVNLSGAKMSQGFSEIASRFSMDAEGFRKASIEYTVRQVRELIQSGVPGIHYYILNSSELMIDLLTRL